MVGVGDWETLSDGDFDDDELCEGVFVAVGVAVADGVLVADGVAVAELVMEVV